MVWLLNTCVGRHDLRWRWFNFPCKTVGCGRYKNGWTYLQVSLKKRHVLCTKCDMPYLVSTMDVSVFAEMLSANIVSWAVRASGLPPKSLQIACSRTSRHLSCLHHTMESEIFGLFYQRSFIDLFGKMAYWGQI